MDLTEGEKAELIRALWSMLESFVGQSFTGDLIALKFDGDIEPGTKLESGFRRIAPRLPPCETNDQSCK